MFDKPNRIDLLETANETLRREVLPHLQGEQKYAGLMVASAIATVMREINSDHNHQPVRRVLDGFATLYGQDNVHHAGGDGEERIQTLNRHLVRDIRDGEFDEDPTGPIFALLMEQALQRLSLSNPSFVEASEYSQPNSS
ncbi:MAG: DUF6285 domain-containing protein [Proteobacteria bacterium]|nr:DUF6285 domain-containing protein [Pseudomonadota bacterium]